MSVHLQAARLRESLWVIMIEQEQFLCITTSGFVRGKRWTRQPLSCARDATKWDGLCGTPELKQDEESHIRQRRSSRVEVQGGWLALSLWASSKTRDGPFWSPLLGSECGLWEFVWEDQSAEWVRQVGPFFSDSVAFLVSQETAHFRFWRSLSGPGEPFEDQGSPFREGGCCLYLSIVPCMEGEMKF